MTARGVLLAALTVVGCYDPHPSVSASSGAGSTAETSGASSSGAGGGGGEGGAAGCVAHLFGSSCAQTNDNRLFCWGLNASGELGIGSTDDALGSVVVASTEPFVEPVIGGHINGVGCIASGGQVLCSGTEGGASAGRLGNAGGSSEQELEFVPTSGQALHASSLAVGWGANCAIVDGSGLCWGNDDLNELFGLGVVTEPTPIPALGSDNAQIVLMHAHGCVRKKVSGAIACWGHNEEGQLGSGGPDAVDPVMVAGLPAAVDVAVGFNTTYVVTDELHGGRVYRLGADQTAFSGTCDDATDTASTTPVMIDFDDLHDIVDIESGWRHACALDANQDVFCGGLDCDGETGQTSTLHQRFTKVGVDKSREIALGRYHSCVLTAKNEVWCWGRNDHGQVGNGTGVPAFAPVRVEIPCSR